MHLAPDAARKGAFKRKGPTIAIVIGSGPKGAPPKDEAMAEDEDGEDVTCPKCGHRFDPMESVEEDKAEDESDAYADDKKADDDDEEEDEEKV